MTQFVTYLRVSTQRQGASGLGLEAQREAVTNFTSKEHGEVIAEYVEIESGKKNARPELEKALAYAKKQGATLLIAKLDRLARNVAFIANLMEAGTDVRAADMPEANCFMFHVMAAVAEQEGRAISERTKAALKAAKARGVKLGWSIPSRAQEQKEASRLGGIAIAKSAKEFAVNLTPIIELLRSQGLSLHGIAKELNARGIQTARGGQWYAMTVKNTIDRCDFTF